MSEVLEIKGIDPLLKKLATLPKEITKQCDNELTASALLVQKKAIGRAPVNTGYLKNSISVYSAPLTKKVTANANYAAYVEFGTGELVSVPKGLEDYAIQFNGKGIREVNLPARPFLFPSLNEVVGIDGSELTRRLSILIEQKNES